MIILKSLVLKNFLSHENTKIEFKPDERLLLDGISGSGKSAIIDAIIWAIFNKGRVQNRSLIRRGAKAANVLLELSDGWVIVRTIDIKGIHTVNLLKDGKPFAISGTKNIQEFIEKEIIKCSYTLFINSVCYPQENLESFVRQTPAKRKDLLLELFRTAQYDELYEKCKLAIVDLEKELLKLIEKNSYLMSDFTVNKNLAAKFDMAKSQVGIYEGILKELSEEIEEIKSEQRGVAILNTKIELCLESIDSIDKELQFLMNEVITAQKQLDAFEALDIEYLKAKEERYAALLIESDGLVAALRARGGWQNQMMTLMAQKPISGEYDQTIDEIGNQIKRLENREIKEELCSQCGKLHKCSLIEEEIQKQIWDWKKKLLHVQEQKQLLNDDLRIFQEKLQELQKQEPATNESRLGEIQGEMRQLKPLANQYHLALVKDGEIQNLRKLIKDSEDDRDNLVKTRGQKKETMNVAEHKVSQINLKFPLEKISALIRDQEQNKVSYMEALQELTLAEAAKAKLVEIAKNQKESGLKAASLKKELNGLLMLKDAFGTNGIKALVLDYAIPTLEDRINEILSQLSDFRIALSTQKSNVEGDAKIEGLFISVVNEFREEFEYDSYSGGQKIKIMFAIAEGLATFSTLSFRLLDEAVQALDDESGQQFAETIIALQNRFQQMIAISHVRVIKDIFESKINVIKLGGISRIESAP